MTDTTYGYDRTRQAALAGIGYSGDGPADPPHQPEPRLAPYCDGPGHLFARLYGPADMDRRPGDLSRIVEPCPTCDRGPLRNHLTERWAS